jgi:hypothetical protein
MASPSELRGNAWADGSFEPSVHERYGGMALREVSIPRRLSLTAYPLRLLQIQLSYSASAPGTRTSAFCETRQIYAPAAENATYGRRGSLRLSKKKRISRAKGLESVFDAQQTLG